MNKSEIKTSMFEQIKRLGTDTAIYGISTIVARLLNFALVPLYANILTPAEMGIIATVYSYIAFITIFYSFGMESSYFRYASAKEIGTEKDNFSTPYLSVILVSGLFSLALFLFASPLTGIFQIASSSYKIIYYTSGILFFDAIVLIPFASLRLQRKAKFFATTKIVSIVITVILNIVTLLILRWGIESVFLSNLVASFVTSLILLPTVYRQFRFSFHTILFKELLKFGLPIVPIGISGVVLQIADRPILRLLMDDTSVGIYQANYRMGIFMALINGMFEYAWRPFFLMHAKDPDAKLLFSRVMTYYAAVTSAVLLFLTLFLPDIIQHKYFGKYILPPSYWPGLNVVPFVMLGLLFSGIATNLNAGIQIQKKTMYLLPTSLSGSITNVALNFLLVPIFGIMGAAYATTIGYAMVAISLYFVVQRFYYIRYEFDRLTKLLLVTVVAFAFLVLFSPALLAKAGIFTGWCVGLILLGFFTPGEISKLKNILQRKIT
ncbi:MAG: oligosaccharide flippase family protein [Bacteroidota bacterium]